ncbi:hypothetical protein HID58_033556 [Brassica napus]|uniref:Tonoplast dicarboxylate transporter n=1 Tax=Brassica napus TaxID=3708 RepID=A0ABQ8BZK2_BRANA|nr:hypothetical protein HID58_033556 [Brassica napus]
MECGHVSLEESDILKSPLLPVVHNEEPHEQQTVAQHLQTIFTPKNCYIALGPLLCSVVCLCVRLGDDTTTARNMLGVLVWIFAWWLTEAVPMPITSMSPLFLFPLFGITSADDVASSYMDDVISLVLGSFILALAVEHYNIHRRLALNTNLLSLTRLPRPSFFDVGGAGARRRRIRSIFFMVSLAPSQSSCSASCFAFTQSFVLDLGISKLEKTFMVSAWLLKTTGPAFSTGDSRKLGKKTTSPHLDPHKGWLSLCNRSATCSVCANGTSFQLFPFSEFNFQLRSRSERTSMGYFGSELLSDKAQSSEIKNTSSCSSSSPSRYKRDSVFLRSGYSIHNLPILLVPSPPSCATALHPRGKMKLSKSLTVLLSCGAVRTGPEDATDFVSTIFRGVDCLSTSRYNVTKFQLSGFAVNLTMTHSEPGLFLLQSVITLVFCVEPLNAPLLLLGICATTAFVSMWMHNVAAVVMMMPVATGILQRLPSSSSSTEMVPPAVGKFCRAMVLGVIYSAAVGGMSTLTGTGVNLILVGMWKSYFPEADPISFSQWFFFGFPLALCIFVTLWGILCVMYCPNGSGKALSPYLHKSHLKRELEMLGPMSFAEKMVLSVFGGLVVLWMTRNITEDIPGWGCVFDGRAGDGTVSVMMATLLFIIPNNIKKGEKLMDWDKCKKLPWNIVLLLGAGFAIADGVRTSGLAEVLSKGLVFLETAPYWAIAPTVCLIAATITEFTSNNATTTLLVPLLIEIAKTMRIHPLLLMVPGAIGAQFAFLLPTGTPSNIVGFTTGHIEIKDMIKTGLALKIAGTVFLSVLMPTLGITINFHDYS